MERDLAPAPSHKNRACRVWRKRVGFDNIYTKMTWSTPTMFLTKRPKGIHLEARFANPLKGDWRWVYGSAK